MAGIAKWLRPRIVVPIYVGSNPTVRPIIIRVKRLFFCGKRTPQGEALYMVRAKFLQRLKQFCRGVVQENYFNKWKRKKPRRQNAKCRLKQKFQDNPTVRPIIIRVKRLFFCGKRTPQGEALYMVRAKFLQRLKQFCRGVVQENYFNKWKRKKPRRQNAKCRLKQKFQDNPTVRPISNFFSIF